jgi:hypothetical protein
MRVAVPVVATGPFGMNEDWNFGSIYRNYRTIPPELLSIYTH